MTNDTEGLRHCEAGHEIEPAPLLVGTAIRRYRKAKNWTVEQLATEIGVTRNTMTNFELGKTEPSASEMLRLADKLGCSLMELFGLVTPPTKTLSTDEFCRACNSETISHQDGIDVCCERDALRRRVTELERQPASAPEIPDKSKGNFAQSVHMLAEQLAVSLRKSNRTFDEDVSWAAAMIDRWPFTPANDEGHAPNSPESPDGSSEAKQARDDLAHLFKHYAPQCEPMKSLMGVVSQIDNLLVGMRDDALVVKAINELRAEEVASVEIGSDNPDFGGPNNAVIVTAEWTGYEPRRFTGDSLFAALTAAVAAKAGGA